MLSLPQARGTMKNTLHEKNRNSNAKAEQDLSPAGMPRRSRLCFSALFMAVLPVQFVAAQASNANPAQCQVRVVANDVVMTDDERTDVAYRVLPSGIIPNPGAWPYFAWSDSPMGVVRSRDGDGYLFFGSDGGCHRDCNGAHPRSGSITVAKGTLDHPLGEPSCHPNPPPYEFLLPTSANLPDYFDYVGGGPVYRVPEGEPGAGNLLLVYHVERPLPSPGAYFWSYTGLAKSTDEGATWQDLGLTLSFSRPYNPKALVLDLGEGSLTVATDPSDGQKYFYTFFEEFYWLNNNNPDPSSRLVSVARAPYEELLYAAFLGDSETVPKLFHKYYKEKWDQPGLGGQSTDLFADGQGNFGQPQVAWSAYRNRFVMTMNNSISIAYGESIDGIHWPPMQTILTSPGTPVYNYSNAVGLGPDPSILGDTFYTYYTEWPSGASWQPATLNRLTITTAATLRNIVPSSTSAGGPAFTLTVNGDHFVKDSTVLWNGSALATTFVSESELTAKVPASEVGKAGRADVEVSNPRPCGGISNAKIVIIEAQASQDSE